ncbi:MAG TPA: hypothetical protein VK470_13170, partial [Bacteroidota bacterium]|nr:hypothetical protein [Bacteroidota bacterium]
MKTLRFHVVLMMLQACLVTGVNAKQCTVAGVTHQPLTQIVLKNYDGSQTTNTDSSGRFRFRVTIRSVQYFQLTFDRTIHLALIPGDSIFVTFD